MEAVKPGPGPNTLHNFSDLADQFTAYFAQEQFPVSPENLYRPAEYFLGLGGKRIRPILCLMGNGLFGPVRKDAFHAAAAIELFHNFTLVHDDIMDQSPLRRGMPTVHEKFGLNTALLSGDMLVITAYSLLGRIDNTHLAPALAIFNRTAKEVCEGQQLDMDFEKADDVAMEHYLEMIRLKTSVLLAASLEIGAVIGGASEGNRRHIYGFGQHLGIAFQVQDDYLDAFGDAGFGKEKGGDIRRNKKTFLLLHALKTAPSSEKAELKRLMNGYEGSDKVDRVLKIFSDCGVHEWATALKEDYYARAMHHLEEIAVMNIRKEPLRDLARYLMARTT